MPPHDPPTFFQGANSNTALGISGQLYLKSNLPLFSSARVVKAPSRAAAAAAAAAAAPTPAAAAAAAARRRTLSFMNAFTCVSVSPVRSTPAAAAAAAAASAAAAAAEGLSLPHFGLFFKAAYSKPSLWGYAPHTASQQQQRQQQQQQQQQQRLWVRCCFELTLPEDTRRRRSRKGSSRNPLKRLLKIPRGGWKQQQTKSSSNSSSSNSSSSNSSSSNSSSSNSSTTITNADTLNSNSRAESRRFLSFKTSPTEGSETQQQAIEATAPTAAAAAAATAAAAGPVAAMVRPLVVDIGANLCDPMFEGKVLRRAEAAGVPQLLLTTGSLAELHTNLKLAQTYDPNCERLFVTVGVHPTRCNEFAATNSSSSSSSSSNSNSSSSSRAEAYEAFSQKLEEGGLRLGDYPEAYRQHLFELQQQLQQQQQQRVVAVGEIGLDYDRLHFCDAETQRRLEKLKTLVGFDSRCCSGLGL
ncbi:hypothetical protein Emag_003227 [Eimeria magna]